MSKRHALLLVVVAATALYLPSLRNGFAYDDVAVIERDARVHSLTNLPDLLLDPYWADEAMGLYRPLVSASYAVDWAVSGGKPLWFHVVNVAWNAAACGALFLLLAAFAPMAAALAGALLFAAHPVHVEAVANVVGRAELIAATLMFSALLLWLRRSVNQPSESRATFGIIALYAMAVLSKESAIMLPALVVLVDAARGELTPTTLVPWLRRHGRTFGVLIVVAVAYLALRTAVLGELGPSRLDPALEIGGPFEQRLTALQTWPVVLRLLLFPVVLLADYGPQILMPALEPNANVLLGAALLLGLIGGGISAWLRGHGRLALVLLWLPVAMLPVSNLLLTIGVLLAERALYLPSAVVAFAVTFAVAAMPAVNTRRVAFALTAGVCVLFAVRSLVRIPEWRTTDTILLAQLRDRPDSFRAHWHHARIALRERQPVVALERYSRALELWPHRRGLVLETARHAVTAGDLAYSRRLTTYMLERWPDDLEASRLAAGAALDMGDTIAARATIQHALQRHPADSLLLRMRAALTTSAGS